MRRDPDHHANDITAGGDSSSDNHSDHCVDDRASSGRTSDNDTLSTYDDYFLFRDTAHSHQSCPILCTAD